MFELKHFAKIEAFERAERADKDPQPPSAFDIDVVGTDNILRRASRRATWWFFLFMFAVLRAIWPVARIGRLVIVSRYRDVTAVLKDHEHFRVPFGPEMKSVTGGVIFGLGLDGDEHAAQREIMESVVRPQDAKAILDHTRSLTQLLIAGSGGRIDVMRDLFGRVLTETCSEYFALNLDEPNAFLNRSMAITSMIFGDPFGNRKARKLALTGAVRIRYLIDRAISDARDRARRHQEKDAVIDRLVAHQKKGGEHLCTDEIRSIVIGIMTGMVPTSTLGAGKMMEELQRRDLLRRAVAHARIAEECRGTNVDKARSNRKILRDILFEALRLNPALSPGLFRHAPRACSIAGTHVPAGSIVLAGAMSALRDSRWFKSPGEFIAERSWAPLPGVQPPVPPGAPTPQDEPATLMFGAGAHGCLAAHLAMEQITEMFQILLSQEDIRFSTRPVGKLAYLGLFPRRLDMEFQPTASPQAQHLVTIQAELEPGRLTEARELITALGNPATLDTPIGKALSDTRVVHFASMSAFDASDPDDPEATPDPRLVFELSVDGDVDIALTRVASKAGEHLKGIFACVKESASKSLVDLLREHQTDLHFRPWGSIGLNFNGTPDVPVDDIAKQKELAAFARRAIDQYLHVHDGVHKRATDALNYVRGLTQSREPPSSPDPSLLSAVAAADEARLRTDGAALRPFLIRPSRRRLAMASWTGRGNSVGWPALIRSNVGLYVGLLIASTALLQGGAIHYALEPSSFVSLGLALAGLLGGAVLIVATVTKDGFDTMIDWWLAAIETMAILLSALAAIALDILFVAFLIVRWFAVPALILGLGMTAHWCLERYVPAIGPAVRIALAGLASLVAFGLLTVAAWTVSRLLRYPRVAATAVAAAVATCYFLQLYAPQLFLGWRIATVTAAVALTVGTWMAWPWISKKLRAHRRLVGEGAALIVTAAAVYAVYANFEFVRAVIGHLGLLVVALGGGLVGTAVLWAAPILVFLAVLYWHEMRDEVDERTAPLRHIQEIAEKESPAGYAHNHITAVTPLKAGGFRKLTLALSLWGIGKLVQYWFRPGFVLNMGTIHYARWLRLPRSEMLVFFSNYDGSWQSYLEDFVTKAHQGQSAAWSNGRGFPRTKLLIYEGAADGDRFKRWVRRQQIVTQFWFSRFPDLTTDQIRCNALIHHGLMHARTDTAARAWLDCFGTIPRPETAIETDEVQSLVFRGLPTHPYTLCAAVTFPQDAGARKNWLQCLPGEIAFGERPDAGDKPVTFVGFSARGVEKCLAVDADKQEATMATFPAAFRLGMGSRSKILGDDAKAMAHDWAWVDVDRPGKADPAVDAMLFIYGKSLRECHDVFDRHRAILRPAAVRWIPTQPTAKTVELSGEYGRATGGRSQKAPLYEHFGFRDGISQPVIRGTQKEATAPGEADVVEAGELILGYRDSSRHIAPAITVAAEHDSCNDLETDAPDFPSRYPRFGDSHSADQRDFGRNGTFVVVRQFEQHVTEFNDFLERQKEVLSTYPGIEDSAGGPITAEWIAAKMMGRWRSGASLVRWAHAMPDRAAIDIEDNDFNFGQDDPQGLRCPLGAHIRRANPRGSLAPDDPKQAQIEKRHRLLRRGRPYEIEEDGKTKKGLVFVGLCADLERQFEFLQQSWIGEPNFHGLTNEPDPITATYHPTAETDANPGKRSQVFSIPTPSGPVTLRDLPSFVTVRAGGYFFMPGRSAIRFLGRL